MVVNSFYAIHELSERGNSICKNHKSELDSTAASAASLSLICLIKPFLVVCVICK